MNFVLMIYVSTFAFCVTTLPHARKLTVRQNLQSGDMNEIECAKILNKKQSDSAICNMYHSCIDGTYKAFICPESYLYSEETQKCEINRKVDCGSRLALDFDNSNDYSSYLKLNIVNGSIECPPGVDGYYSDPEYCNIYHRCIGGIDYVEQCMHQLVWNDRKKICDWQTNVNCSGKTIPVAYGETSFCTDKTDNKYKHADYCNVFHHCVGGIDNVIRCDGELQWNDNQKKCDWESVVKCSGNIF